MNKASKTWLAAAALAVAGSAHAASFQFNTVGQSVTTLYAMTFAGADLSASVTYTLITLGSNSASFAVSVNNTTPTAQPGTNRLTIFGVDVVTPSLTAASGNSSVFNNVVQNSNMPGIGTIDFCATSGPNCSGGGGGGLGEQLSDSFTLSLGFSQTVPPITFENFVVRYQSVGPNGDSIAFSGCVQGDAGCGPTNVPEPATLALVGGALLGLAASRRRRMR